jgi:hypothetical protein
MSVTPDPANLQARLTFFALTVIAAFPPSKLPYLLIEDSIEPFV